MISGVNFGNLNFSSKPIFLAERYTKNNCNTPEIGTAIAKAREISNFKKSAEIIERINTIFKIIGAAAAVLNLPEAFKIPLINAANDINRMYGKVILPKSIAWSKRPSP